MRTLTCLVAVSLLALPAVAQTRSQLKRELKAQEAEASDAAALLEVAAWAKAKGLLTDHKRLLRKVLEIDAENETALKALGYVQYKGEWMDKAKAAILQKREQEAAYKAKGLTEVDGVWVAKNEVADAKKGIYHHGGEVIGRAEKLAFMAGKVRHPVTGTFIAAADLDKAKQGMFPVGDGQWADREEADRYHSNPEHPWIIRSHYGWLLTTLPLQSAEERKREIDGSYEVVKPLFGSRDPHPSHRPVVIVCSTTDEYRAAGDAFGDGYSTYGAFLAAQDPSYDDIELPTRPAVANFGEPNWGPYYVRHAAGLAYAQAMSAMAEAELPLWLRCGIGSWAERHYNPGIAKWFGNQHLGKGGVKELKTWFADFAISGELSSQKLEYNIYQAGLVVTFSMRGGDQDSVRAAQAFTASFDKGGRTVERAAQGMERVMMGKEEEIRAYFKQILEKG